MNRKQRGNWRARLASRGGMSKLAVKAAVRERDGNACVECGMSYVAHVFQYGRDLEVHRVTPGSVYTVGGCVTLCMQCHDSKPVRKPGEPDQENPYVCVSVPKRYHSALKELAERLGVSVTEIVRRGVDKELRENGIEPPDSEGK